MDNNLLVLGKLDYFNTVGFLLSFLEGVRVAAIISVNKEVIKPAAVYDLVQVKRENSANI